MNNNNRDGAMRLAGFTQKVTIEAAENSSIFVELLKANLVKK